MKKQFILNSKQFIVMPISIILILGIMLIITLNSGIKAFAEESNEIYYSDDDLFLGGGVIEEVTEEIRYSRKVEQKYLINESFPNYYNTNEQLSNVCANVAGANIIGYYDRYFENLIPNYNPGVQRPNKYTYSAMTSNRSVKQELIDNLYVKMQTNTISSGTSQSQYKNGLTSYVKEKGYNIEIKQIMSGTKLDINAMDNQLRAGYPISVYLTQYNFSDITDSGNAVSIKKTIYAGNHIMIVYGYNNVKYYDSNNNIVSTRVYLYVASGDKNMSNIYILDERGLIDADAIRVY